MVVINLIVSYWKYVGQELHVRTVVVYSTSLTMVHNSFTCDMMWPLIKWFGHVLKHITSHHRNRTFFYSCIAVCIYMYFWSHRVTSKNIVNQTFVYVFELWLTYYCHWCLFNWLLMFFLLTRCNSVTMIAFVLLCVHIASLSLDGGGVLEMKIIIVLYS